jgi:S-ribosylhomocysteine lyase
MEKIPSFTIDHNKLIPGVYVSRTDAVGGDTVTTFDLRFTRPNREPVMNTGTAHAIEHLAATFMRNDVEMKDRIVYFGPMGCRTGFYLLIKGPIEPKDIYRLLKESMKFICDFEGEIPGAAPKDCGNYSDMDLIGAKAYAKKFLNEVIADFGPHNTVYPK